MMLTVVKELQSYYSYPTLTSVEVESHLEIEFPSVTFCNLNSINRAAMTNDSRTDNYYISIGPHETSIFKKDFNWTDPFYLQEGFFENRTVTDILKESKSLFTGFLSFAMFDQILIGYYRPASPMDYFSVILTQNGPCLTSNINKTLKTSNTGSGFNLLLWLNVQSENNYFSTWLGEGVKVPLIYYISYVHSDTLILITALVSSNFSCITSSVLLVEGIGISAICRRK